MLRIIENIKDKVIVITGASSGIGAASSKALAAGGAKIVMGARRKNRLQSLSDEIKDAGGDAIFQVTDVVCREQVEALVQLAIDHYGRIDVMINNAGIMPVAPMEMLRVDDWSRMIDVNVKGVLYGIGAALPHMKAQKKGHFINVASVAGHKVLPNVTVYCATKHAVRVISEGLRIENPDLRVTIISPGLIDTELADSVPDESIRKGVKARYAEHAIPVKAISDAIVYAISQPDNVDVNELLIRPITQEA